MGNWLTDKLRQYSSLDKQEQGLGDDAAEMAAGFIPGVGQAMALRDFERSRRDSDYLGMGLSAVSLIPGGHLVKGLRKGGNAARELIAGRKAIGAPTSQLDMAETLRKQGKTPQQQWDMTNETGKKAYVAPDGHAKFEIDDTPARIHQGFDTTALRDYNDTVPLSKILHHPELFEKYPHLRDVNVYGGVSKENKGNAAYYGKKASDPDDFELIENNARNDAEYMSNLLHEIEHGIQAFEGFSGGANYGAKLKKATANFQAMKGMAPGPSDLPRLERSAMTDYMHNMGEAESRAVEKRWVNDLRHKVPSAYDDVNMDQLYF